MGKMLIYTSKNQRKGHSIMDFWEQVMNLPVGEYNIMNGVVKSKQNNYREKHEKRNYKTYIDEFNQWMFCGFVFFFLREVHILNMILYVVIQMLGLKSLDETLIITMFDILISVGCANVLFRSLKKGIRIVSLVKKIWNYVIIGA